MTSQLTPDPRVAELLAILHQGGQYGYYWQKQGKRSQWFAAGEAPELPSQADLYFGVHPTTTQGTPTQRATIATIAAINCLYAEFDAKDYGDDLPQTLAHIERCELMPSVIVESGGGYHCYWLLDVPFVLDTEAARTQARTLQAGWVDATGGDGGAKDLARILRVPGTINTKYQPPRAVQFIRCALSYRYDLSELAARITPAPSTPAAPAAAVAAPPPLARPTPSDRQQRYAQKALADECAALASAGQGSRNDTLNKAAYNLGQLVGDGLLDETEVYEALAAAASQTGLPASELHATLRSGLAKGMRKGRSGRVPDMSEPPPFAGMGQLPHAASTPAPHEPAIPKSFILKCLTEDESGDGLLFQRLFQGKYVYDRAAATWFAFTHHAWHALSGPPRPAVYGRLAATYLALAAQLQAEHEQASEDEQKKLAGQVAHLIGRAKALRRLTRCNNVLTFAGDEGVLGIRGDEWDANPWLMGVKNGVVDLRTGQRRDGQPHDYIQTQALTEWNGLDAPAPRWERFVHEVMSGETDRAAFLHRTLGYALNGTTREHILVMLVGDEGRNGKGVLFETLRNVLGGYAGAVHTDVITGQQNHRTAGAAQPHLMDLRGKRLAFASETAKEAQMSAAQVKLITGGDAVTARRLHENLITFTPTHTLFVATNRRPHADADDAALWERVKVLEFKSRWVEEPTKPNEQKQDTQLREKLEAEGPGILAWLVRGHMAWQQDGLQTPESVKVARDTYRLGESIDPFIATRCTEWDGGQVEAGILWEAYKTWCEAEGLRAKTQHWFGRQLAARYEKGRTSTGRTCYFGLDLHPDALEHANPSDDAKAAQQVPVSEGSEPVSNPSGSYPLPALRIIEMPSEPSAPHAETPPTGRPALAQEPPPGCALYRCDHKGNLSCYGTYWCIRGPDGQYTDFNQYIDMVVSEAWARWGPSPTRQQERA